MSTPEPPISSGTSSSSSTSTHSPSNPSPLGGTASTSATGPKPLEPLTGFRAALEHTGLPRGLLTWKPRLPSRNWTIFWTLLGTVSYIYYDDRRKCRLIKEEYINKLSHMAKERTVTSLDQPRRVVVYGAKWAEDEDTDRALRHFRKYVKPYLVAAAVDYQQITSPLHGSITRIVHANILKRRRQALGLEARETPLSLPVALNPDGEEKRELDGGVVLVGRASLKEYLEGLKRGWSGGVNAWEWEKEVEGKIQFDGVFEDPPSPEDITNAVLPTPEHDDSIDSSAPPKPLSGLSFLSRPAPATPIVPSPTPGQNSQIPSSFHTPPSPLPPTPSVLLVPFTNHLGFKQTPWMIYDFFTEHRRVQAGAKAAYALIMGNTRPFVPPTPATSTESLESFTKSDTRPDTEFDKESEKWYYSSFKELPDRVKKAREDYYPGLKERLEAARQFARGEREMTDAEKKASKVVTENDLREERKKRELRWHGNIEGYEIVRPGKEAVWDGQWKEGWLRVYTMPEDGPSTRVGNDTS